MVTNYNKGPLYDKGAPRDWANTDYELGPYLEEGVRRFAYGARHLTWDGRVFKYVKATNIVSSIHQGLKFWSQLSDGITYSSPIVQTEVIGSRTIRVDAGGAAAVAEDELVGGFIVVHTHVVKKHQFRAIIGNSLADASGYTVITVEYPFTVAIATAFGIEVWQNPYSNVRLANSSAGSPANHFSSVAGMPATTTAVANRYLWLQTWGPHWCNPHGTSGAATVADEREFVFDWEGSVCPQADAVGADDALQRAGFSIARVSGVGVGGGEFIMLQVSI